MNKSMFIVIRVCVFLALVSGAVAAEGDLVSGLPEEVRTEIEYAEGLIDLGLPTLAEEVLGRVKHPAAKPHLKRLQLEGLLVRGAFDEAKAVISRQADQNSQDTWAMKLALGDAYYAWGKYAEARGVYEAFFRQYPDGPPEGIKDFYLNSAYRYAQMLILINNRKEAVEAYENVLKALPRDDAERKHVRRQMLGEMAELMVKIAEGAEGAEREKYFKRIEETTQEILWVQDLWFGKAIVVLAHLNLLKGDIDGAMRLIDDYRDQLEQIDATLREQEKESGESLAKLSPMAQCRYLIGVIMQEEAERILREGGDRKKAAALLAGKETAPGKRSSGAYKHFLNVFIGYPMTQWAPEAGVRAREVEEILKTEFDAKITTQVSREQMAEVRKAQFQEARALFNQRRYDEAVNNYVAVLNLFPESDTSVGAVSELARCYMEMMRDYSAEMAIRYLAERFSKHDTHRLKAGDELIRIAEKYGELDAPAKKDAVYKLFFDYYADHPKAALTLLSFGNRKFEQEDYESAKEYYGQVIENHKGTVAYYGALNKLAQCYSKEGDHVLEIKTLNLYAEELGKKPFPGHAFISAKFRLAHAYKELGEKYIPSAFNRYSEIIKLLNQTPDKFAKTDEEKASNLRILQGAMYYKGICYAMLKEPPEKVTAYRQSAIKTFRDLIDQYPDSEFAPAALNQVGTLWTILEKPDEARLALNKLQDDYPDSPEAKNALFMLGRNLLELGMRQEATRVFTDMFDSGGANYSESQILTAGSELLEAGEHDIALEAFDRIISQSDQPSRIQRAMLGKGKALIATGDAKEGIQALEELLNKYPGTGLTVEASLLISETYAALAEEERDADRRFDLFNDAVLAMKTVRKYAKEAGTLARSDLGVARIKARKAAAESRYGSEEKAADYRNEAIAAFQIIMMTADTTNPDVRPHVESAYHECIPLLIEAGELKDAVRDGRQYLELFPAGRHVGDIEKYVTEAQVKLTAMGGSSAVGAEDQIGEEPETAEQSENAEDQDKESEVDNESE